MTGGGGVEEKRVQEEETEEESRRVRMLKSKTIRKKDKEKVS
jgi:hypothetical protein